MVYAPPFQTKGHPSIHPARQSGLVSSRDQGLQYDGNNVLADLTDGNVSKFYVTPFLDQNLSMTVVCGPDAGIYYYSQDGLGSVRTLTNSSGNLANHYDHDAFGVPQAVMTSESVENRYTYTGRETSGVSGGPMYYRYRMTFNEIGRFGRRDPASEEMPIRPFATACLESVAFINSINKWNSIGLSDVANIYLRFAAHQSLVKEQHNVRLANDHDYVYCLIIHCYCGINMGYGLTGITY